jgi:hypothetical protein
MTHTPSLMLHKPEKGLEQVLPTKLAGPERFRDFYRFTLLCPLSGPNLRDKSKYQSIRQAHHNRTLIHAVVFLPSG